MSQHLFAAGSEGGSGRETLRGRGLPINPLRAELGETPPLGPRRARSRNLSAPLRWERSCVLCVCRVCVLGLFRTRVFENCVKLVRVLSAVIQSAHATRRRLVDLRLVASNRRNSVCAVFRAFAREESTRIMSYGQFGYSSPSQVSCSERSFARRSSPCGSVPVLEDLPPKLRTADMRLCLWVVSFGDRYHRRPTRPKRSVKLLVTVHVYCVTVLRSKSLSECSCDSFQRN